MNKVLIVGGAGYIGGYMTNVFNNSNYDVTVYDSLLYESRFLKDVKFINGDVRDRNKLLSILDGYDIVIWLAALVGDGACAINLSLTKEINYDSVKWLVDNYKKKIIFTSTCSVYGINNDLIDEEANPNPLSVYAETKLLAEQYLINNHDNYTVFRLGTLYGLGDLFSRIRLDLVVNVLSKKASQGDKLSVFGGEQWRPLLHVRDVAEASLYCIKNNITGLFNLSAKNFTIKGIAEKIRTIKSNAEIEYCDINFEDLRNYKVNTDKITNAGFNKFSDIIIGINEIITLFEEKRITDPDDPVYSNVAHLQKIYNNGYN